MPGDAPLSMLVLCSCCTSTLSVREQVAANLAASCSDNPCRFIGDYVGSGPPAQINW